MTDNAYLNRAQLRTQTIKDDLKNLTVAHLHTFIKGINNPEPPIYEKASGRIFPALEDVTIKDGGNCYDFGNVSFCEELGGSVQRIWVSMEKGEVELNGEDALPKDKDNPLSVPMPDTVFLNLLELWKKKYEAIDLCVRRINETRALAHNAPNMRPPTFAYGEKATKLQRSQNKTNGSPQNASGSKKREHDGNVVQDPANKRKKIGLASIPDYVKRDIFDNIPEETKVNFFNTVAKVAFPNMDDVLAAAWNVISVYQIVGTDLPVLHKSMLELHKVLLKTDNAYKKIKSEHSSDRDDRNESSPVHNRTSIQANAGSQLDHPERKQEGGYETSISGDQLRDSVQAHKESLESTASGDTAGTVECTTPQLNLQDSYQAEQRLETVIPLKETSEVESISARAEELQQSARNSPLADNRVRTDHTLPHNQAGRLKQAHARKPHTQYQHRAGSMSETSSTASDSQRAFLVRQLKSTQLATQELTGRKHHLENTNERNATNRRLEQQTSRPADQNRFEGRDLQGHRNGEQRGPGSIESFDGSNVSSKTNHNSRGSLHQTGHQDRSYGLFVPPVTPLSSDVSNHERRLPRHGFSSYPTLDQDTVLPSTETVFLGNSKLGPMKSPSGLGSAPTAPMMHVVKNGTKGTNGTNGGEHRRYGMPGA